ncbi:DNA polymerase IV [Streptomyces sp. NBC_00151]|uniref:DNA polymerase IV n=1 Tax=Streptomyces sp. NBC_00151 TaxID=2975669 RepID=UPI002DDC179A|nr:DNA polymerase IV [Streptomyces sp. NBC_00151]WRZ43079.1 DNA polymerase IV [Streptomyces sp. NBC_00151]
MRTAPTILHLDMDAFFASAEQASKPSLRGKAVVVGGLGPRGVVATASYEARVFGVNSAMPMAQARRRAPNAAYLVPRFGLYREVSEQVMGLLRALSPLVEPLSLDEAFVDLEAGGTAWDEASARLAGAKLRADIRAVTGLTGSVGLAASKMLAKIASEQAKPDGLVLIDPGTERALLGPMPVRTLPGVGPATGDHLRRAGITTVEELAEAGEDELVRLLGKAHGHALFAMALAHDERPVVAERETKSVSVEDTYDVDIHDRVRVELEVQRLADRCVRRLRRAGLSGRTIVLKVRRYDFSTLTRSETLRGPTDDPGVVREAAARLLEGVDTTGGVRLLGVGVTGLADYTQEDLFAQAQAAAAGEPAAEEHAGDEPAEVAVADGETAPAERRWPSGHDVRHTEFGHGWVQGSGLGRVTVRFETPYSGPGRVRTFRTDDAQLEPADPLPLVERRPEDADRLPPGPGSSVSAVGAHGSGPGDQVSSDPASRPKSRSGGGGDATSSP